jgi:hypothetical protein
MRLDQYQWSRNPRGLHVASIYQSPLDVGRYTLPRMGWAKLMAAGYEYVDDAVHLLQQGITPVVRVYLGAYGAGPFTREHQSWVYAFSQVGVKWFEFYNEPNLGVEWPDGFNPDWRNFDGVIRPLVDNWLNFAEYCISLGCYPGFISLAESDTPQYAAVPWMDSFLNYLASAHNERFRYILGNGMYAATHPYILNHFYQERPGGGPYSVRQPAEQNGQEGGWHFEYPYDPISQRADPGRTVYGGTAQTPYGDPVGLTAMGQMFNERCAALFGSQAVPVLGTEGGIFPFRNETFQQDTRYPPYNERSQAEATLGMFNWIATQAPPWFFGVTLWKEDEYYLQSGGHVAAIDRLVGVAPVLKSVPAIEVMGAAPLPDWLATLPSPGPGPIHGQADFHLVILSVGLESEWFFDTAQAYYEAFRPIVTTLPELIRFVPPTRSLAATLLTPPELADLMRRAILDQFPNVYIDLILTDDLERVRAEFDDRAQTQRRFG